MSVAVAVIRTVDPARMISKGEGPVRLMVGMVEVFWANTVTRVLLETRDRPPLVSTATATIS